MVQRNRYSTEFKKKIGIEIATGETSIASVSKREKIAPTTLSDWRDKFGFGITPVNSESDKELIELRKRNLELECALGQMTFQLYLKKKSQMLMEQQKKKEHSSKIIYQNELASKKPLK